MTYRHHEKRAHLTAGKPPVRQKSKAAKRAIWERFKLALAIRHKFRTEYGSQPHK
jgi:hypothetical protein